LGDNLGIGLGRDLKKRSQRQGLGDEADFTFDHEEGEKD
jgi:hypothetical protein